MARHVDALDVETTEKELARNRQALTGLQKQLAANVASQAKAREDAARRDAEQDEALRIAATAATRHRHEWIEQSRAAEDRLAVLERGASNATVVVTRLAEEMVKQGRTTAAPDTGHFDKALAAHRTSVGAQLQELRGQQAEVQTRDKAQDEQLATLVRDSKALQAALKARPSPTPAGNKALTELAGRIGAVEKATRDLAGKPDSAAGLRKDIEDLKKGAASRELSFGMARTEAQKRDEALERRITLLYKQVASLPKEAMAPAAGKPGVGEKELAELRTKLSSVEDAAGKHAGEIAGLRKALAAVSLEGGGDTAKQLRELENMLKARLGPLEDSAIRRDGALAEVNKGLANHAQRLTQLGVALAAHREATPHPTNTDGQGLAKLQARLSEVEKLSKELTSTTAELKKVKPSPGKPASPGAASEEHLKKLERTLMARFAPVEVSLTETREAISDVRKRLGGNSEEIAILRTTTGRLEKGLAGLGKQSDDIRSLRETTDSLAADIRKRFAGIQSGRPPVAPPPEAAKTPAADDHEGSERQDPPEVADLITRARVLASQGNAAEAESLFKQALDRREKALGTEDSRVAASLTDLGLLLLGTGRLSEAELHLVRALELYRRVEGEKHQHVGTALNNVAKLRERQGNLAEAASKYQHAIETFEEALGSKHAYVATTLSNLGMLLRRQKDFEAGDEALKRCLKIRERNLEKTHPKVAETLNNLALLYMDWDKPDRCEPLFERALEIYRNAYGQDHPSVRAVIGNMAVFYTRTGENEKAELYRAMARQPSAEGR